MFEHHKPSDKPSSINTSAVAKLAVALAVIGVVFFMLNHATLEAALGIEIFKLNYQCLTCRHLMKLIENG